MLSEVGPLTAPVVLVVHRRPEKVARVVERIRAARPQVLFVAADVPASGADDPEHREAVRLATDVDWPCELQVTVSERPLGCSPRILSAIDWAFESVDRLVVIEDDVVVDPTFIPWSGMILNRYEDDPSIGHVSGRNELIRWPTQSEDHLIVRRGSMWGWGTWRDVWHRYRTSPEIASPSAGSLVDEHLALLNSRESSSLAWDIDFSRFLISSELRSVVPSVNLVDNIGFGVAASHTTYEDDIRGHFPTGSAVPTLRETAWASSGVQLTAETYVDAALLIGLMATYRAPGAVARLSRLVERGSGPDLDAATLHHLAPFRRAEFSARALAHLRFHGVDPSRLAPIEQALASVLDAGRVS
ncbi:MAG: hypothetical protein F2520_06895 [Actinobacteria bacterium]|uniref:Unannotated protein n=1 Tax=freshwater metagenome TaxID=449393 RepID=A0A6J5YBY8_9ZZZZ|nr:hypothetical protein [Actinomycetota bacterium]MTA77970.1 hypothetical protein [Actinomycetota bacterium]